MQKVKIVIKSEKKYSKEPMFGVEGFCFSCC